MPVMDNDDLAELAKLRARAYGPTSAEAMDAAAWTRLQDLESASRRPSVVVDPPPAPAAAPTMDAAETLDAAQAMDAAAAPASQASAPLPSDPEPAVDELQEPARRRGSRRMRWLWVASLAVVAAVSIAATYAVASVRPVDPTTGVLPAALLEPNPAIALPRDFFGLDGSIAVYEFYGLWVIRSNSGAFAGAGDCILVTSADAVDTRTSSITGPAYYGCEAGSFPATAQFALDGQWPQALLDRYPVGSGMRFVIDGDRVGVFISEVPETPATSGD